MPEFDNGLPANRLPDSVDRQQVVPAALHVYDAGAGAWVPATEMAGGSGADPASAREATLELVRQLLAGTLNVNTGLNGLATQATLEAARVLLAGTLAVSAASLPLPTGAATEAKLEAVRLLLAGTLKTVEQVVAPGTLTGDIASGSSTGAAVNLAGLSVVRIVIGAVWTAADLSFETSTDGTTWMPLYDAYGSLIVYKAAASRSITVPVGDLLRVNRVRVRSGVPGAYVSQVALAGVTLVTAAL